MQQLNYTVVVFLNIEGAPAAEALRLLQSPPEAT